MPAAKLWTEFSLAPGRRHFDDLLALRTGQRQDYQLLLMCYWCARALGTEVSATEVQSLVLEGVSQFPGDTPLMNLLIEELHRNATLRTLDHAPIIWQRLSEPKSQVRYLKERWKLLVESSAFAQLQSELPLHRPAFLPDRAATWLELLLDVFQSSVFTRTTSAASLNHAIMEEVDELGDALGPLQGRINHCDLLQFMLHDVGDLPIHDKLTGFLTHRSFKSHEDLRQAFFGVVDGWVEQPGRALEQITHLAAIFKSGFARLQQLVDIVTLRSEFHPHADATLTTSLSHALDAAIALSRRARRLAFVEIARDECLSFHNLHRQLRDYASSHPAAVQILADTQTDEPLRLVVNSVHAFLESA